MPSIDLQTPGIPASFGRDISWLLSSWAQRKPYGHFLVWVPFSPEEPARTWSFRDFDQDVERVAAGMQSGGVRQGDRVLIHMENCPEFLMSWFACARLGATAVCTNTKSPVPELSYFGEHASVVAAVTQQQFVGRLEEALPNARWIASTGDTSNTSAIPFRQLMSSGQLDSKILLSGQAPLSIQYTSGTTARPKAVIWTHANALFGAKACAQHEALRGDDVHLVHLPLFHTNALMYSVLASLWVGAKIVLQPRFSASRFWDVAVRHECTWSSVVLFCLRALAKQGDVPSHKFRLWGNGVSGPPEDDVFGVRTIGWFGMTETVSHCVVDDVEHPGRRMGMGRPAPEYGVRLQNDDGRSAEIEEVGSLQIRGVPGVSLFGGYLHEPDATKASFTEDGWFMTGDLARLHADGHLSYVGRSKDMMKVGGENVAALEIERVISEIAQVAEVAVVGRPDEMLSEVPVAFVVTDVPSVLLAEAIDLRCRETLAAFKVPQEIRFVSDLPRSTLNKVSKAELRRLLDGPA